MPFVPVPDCVEVSLHFTSTAFHGGNPVIRFYVRDIVADTTVFSYVLACAEAYRDDFWTGEMKGIASDNLRLDKVKAVDASQEDGVQAELIVNDLGSVATPVLPANVAALARWRSAESGPPTKGFTYFPGLVEAHVDFNSLSATGAIAWQGVAQVAKDTAGLVSGTSAFVIVSKYEGSTLGPVQPNGTRRMVPTPRASALTNTVQDPTVRVAVSHQDRRIRPT